MARAVTVSITDDLDGGPADETVYFCLDATSYEIDLTTENASELRHNLGRYLTHGRIRLPAVPVTASHPADPGMAGAGPPSQTAVIRAWARNHGFAVSRVGRLPEDVERAYDEAIGGSDPVGPHACPLHRTSSDRTETSAMTDTPPMEAQ